MSNEQTTAVPSTPKSIYRFEEILQGINARKDIVDALLRELQQIDFNNEVTGPMAHR